MYGLMDPASHNPPYSSAITANADQLMRVEVLHRLHHSELQAPLVVTALIIYKIVNTFLLLVDVSTLFDTKKCPLALLRALLSERYDVLLCPARTMSLAW